MEIRHEVTDGEHVLYTARREVSEFAAEDKRLVQPLSTVDPQADLLYDLLARLLTGHASAFRLNIPEEAVCFTIDPSSEEEIVGCARGCVIPKLQGPQAIDLYGNACAILK